MIKICTSLIVLIFVLLPVSAQTDAITNKFSCMVKGEIRDSLTTEVIPYATVRVINTANPVKIVKILVTDENGKYQIPIEEKGDYIIFYEYVGKKTKSIPIQIEEYGTADVGIIFLSDNVHLLSEVIVSAPKPLIKVDVDKITYKMENDPESETNNVLEMLRKVPMLSLDGDENVRMKGSSNYKIYLNGKPSNMIMSNPKDVLRSMPANSVKDIEIITDPGVKYDAEGLSGIINIVMKRNSMLTGYTGTLNGRIDDLGGFGSGLFLQLKYGKVGFTGGYNYNQNKTPKSSLYRFTEDYTHDFNKFQYQNGFSKTKRHGQSINGEFSIEIDTLNSFYIGINQYNGKVKSDNEQSTEMFSADNSIQYRYDSEASSSQKDGGTDFNLDYQRMFNNPNQLLTASYRFSTSPNDRKSENSINPIIGQLPETAESNIQYTDTKMNEHTVQADFITPFGKMHNIEFGVKYINRLNKSHSGYSYIDVNGEWSNNPQLYDNFKYNQDIFATYGGYSTKILQWGIKAGIRYEATWLEAKFPEVTDKNFKNDYSNVIPSAAITYQINPTQNIRISYNMRLQRPGIYQLNPYEDTSNPNNIRIGNPELDAVQNHSININYGMFSRAFSFIGSLTYDLENNGIVDITSRENGISTTTFKNIGKKRNLGFSYYINWIPNNKFAIYSNMDGRYIDIKSNHDPYSNKKTGNNGFIGNIVVGGQYSFPYNLKAYMNGGYFSPQINLQGKSSSFFFHSLSVVKILLKSKLQIRAYAQNPFDKDNKHRNTINTDSFYSESHNIYRGRQYGVAISFRFGEMKSQIKKNQRGIVNDDIIKISEENQDNRIENNRN